MTLRADIVKEAERRGYLEFNDRRDRVTYNCGRESTYSYSHPEERVRARIYSWLVIEKGYPANRIEMEFEIPRREPSDYADIVVFQEDAREQPFLVVEVKKDDCSDPEWRQAIEQGFGNANSLRTTRYLLVDKDDQSMLFDIQNHPPTERLLNRLGNRATLPENYGIAQSFRLIAGTTSDIEPLPAHQLEKRIRRAHALIWSGGKRDPLKSFDEWSKLLFAKILDERRTPNGSPRHFQIASGETISQAGTRIRDRFAEACYEDRTIFSNPVIDLPDDIIWQILLVIQDISFTECSIDTVGAAFEHFFSSVFRGELGQYFTRRELVRFVCGMVEPTERDFILDPTAGSGGFLLESLIQTWHRINAVYGGQPETERRRIDFALNHLYGIEIHSILSRLCKLNLYIHKDGHTNIEGERSCLDSSFSNPRIRPDGSIFTVVLGNPPFGDKIREGDIDRLGTGSLSNFELSEGLDQISSELIIIERSLQFLSPGGRLGMVVPDGVLNNQGEASRCPAFRRYILRNAVIEAVVSLPDYAFRKAGAQNKTSLLFLRKFTGEESELFNQHYSEYVPQDNATATQNEGNAIRNALSNLNYEVFFAEAENIGYSSTGATSETNELYSMTPEGTLDPEDSCTVLGQYRLFKDSPDDYRSIDTPRCLAADITDVLDSHDSYRIDAKFHLFRNERIQEAPEGMNDYCLDELLSRRTERVEPTESPDVEFLTITLHQDGTMSPREAGKGRNPPSWHGSYFTEASRWYRIHTGDLLLSRIDLWKGCICVVEDFFDGAIVTQEYPVYEADEELIDPRYLVLLLRTSYFRRAIKSITTGHSNRRRTPLEDFENLRVFLPPLDIQKQVADLAERRQSKIREAETSYELLLRNLEEVLLGRAAPSEVLSE